MAAEKSGCMGIIADSHGRSDLIETALKYLLNQRCDRIIHLGDICDSFSPQTCDPCLNLLMENHILAVKGNNDHILEINQSALNHPGISRKSLSYLKSLLPVIECGDTVFAHSLPFFEELGLSCITRFMGESEINRFFSRQDHGLLFRGHGHDPEMVWKDHGTVRCMELPAGSSLTIEPYLPCIVTCGALTSGLLMIWDAEAQLLKSLSFL
jgi:predicted phosphodiesterase